MFPCHSFRPPAQPIGALRDRTVQGKAPQDDGPQEYQTIPIDKIGDFGMHVKQYVSVVVEQNATECKEITRERERAREPQAFTEEST